MSVHRKLLQSAIALVCVLLLLNACNSDFSPVPTPETLELTGRYHSSEPFGSLGTITMQIEYSEDVFPYYVWLAGVEEEDGLSFGIATIGDRHVILNFDRGLNSDFYFEGDVEVTDGQVEVITGMFVFPDNSESRPITFNFVEPV